MTFQKDQRVFFVRDDETNQYGKFGESWDGMASVFYQKYGKEFYKIVPLDAINVDERELARLDNSQPQSYQRNHAFNFKQLFW